MVFTVSVYALTSSKPKTNHMKKILLTLVAVLAFYAVQAQGNFQIGGAIGFPTADAADVSDFMFSLDAYYMFKKEDAFLNLGPTVGYRHFFGKDITIGDETASIDDGTFLPIGAAGRITIFGTLRAGADAGYAIGLADFLDGGFYFRPMVGLDILDFIELNAAWENIWDEATWGSFQIGAKFEF